MKIQGQFLSGGRCSKCGAAGGGRCDKCDLTFGVDEESKAVDHFVGHGWVILNRDFQDSHVHGDGQRIDFILHRYGTK